MEYIKNNDLEKELKVINIEFNNEDEVANVKLLEQAFQQYGSIKAAITFNSRVYRLARHLANLNHSDIRLIGYDLLEQNVSYLKQDVISYLIAQRPDRQAYLTVRDMCRELIFKQGIKKVNYVPIDILMKENIEDYIHFRE
jgi:LacI family transcriptional regulator